MVSTQNVSLKVRSITSENFQPYGQVIWAIEDGKPYGVDEAQLDLSQGAP
ncbi:Ureidoglycolate hydrolase, partial [Leptolyngbya sp. FACHB-36]|nr:Ureidoglycolate hydrolase [Leptolyngbya sp. FACHB-36]